MLIFLSVLLAMLALPGTYVRNANPLMSTQGQTNITCFNVNGFTSSQPYILKLLEEAAILGISEHWLSGPELYKLDSLSQTHESTSKCHNDLVSAPPERGRGYGGVAIFWRKNIIAVPICGISSDRIIGIKAEIGLQKLCVINVYVPSDITDGATVDSCLEEMLGIILDVCHEYSIIVMGDFNVQLGIDGGPRGTGICSNLGRRILDMLCNEDILMSCCDMSYKGQGPVFTFQRQGIGKSWIDHIFVSNDMYDYIYKCEVIKEDLLNVSDHLPVSLTLSLKEGQSSPVSKHPYIKVNKIKWHKLTSELIKDEYTDITNIEFEPLYQMLIEENVQDVNVITDKITSHVVRIAESRLCKKQTKNVSNAKPFWSERLSFLSKCKKEAFHKWVLAGRPREEGNVLLAKHLQSKKEFRKCFRQEEAIFRSQIEDDIEKCQELDQKQFWYLLKRGKNITSKGHILKDDNDNITSDVNKVKNMWKNHFEKLGNPHNEVRYDHEFKELVDEQIQLMSLSDEEMADNVLEEPITAEEVEKVCVKLKTGKAQDFMNLSYEHFKFAGYHVYLTLAYLFNCIIQQERLPDVFKKGITIPLFKGGDKDVMDCNSYRGITLQSTMCKIYESIICNRSERIIKKSVGICEVQAACKKGLSSVQSSLLLQESVSHCKETDKNIYVTFDVDFVSSLYKIDHYLQYLFF